MPAVPKKLIVVGGSVTGLYTAIGAARHGIPVTLIEKYPQQASRRTIFNLAPSVADSLQRLDGGGDGLTRALQLIVERGVDDTVNAQHAINNAGDRMVIDPRRPLTADALVAGFEGRDSRPWSRVQIAGIENHMREYLAARHPEVLTLYGTELLGLTQTRRGVTAHVKSAATGAQQSIDGAYLVSATGGRNILGVKRTPFLEQAHFVGGLMKPTTADRMILTRGYRDGSELSPSTRTLNPAGKGFATVTLPGTGRRELPESLMWAQIDRDAKGVDPALLRKVIRDRARTFGFGDLKLLPGDSSLLPVTVQLSYLQQPAVHGRVLLAGDELIGPYFPTSTGGSHAIGVNGPLVVDTLRDVWTSGRRASQRLRDYDNLARAEALKVVAEGRNEMLEDLGLPRRASLEDHLADLASSATPNAGTAAP